MALFIYLPNLNSDNKCKVVDCHLNRLGQSIVLVVWLSWCMYSRMGVWPGGGLTVVVVFPSLGQYLCHSPGHCLTPALPLPCFPSSSTFLNLTIVSLPSLLLFVYYNLTHLPLFSCFFLYCLPLSSACSRVMVCCGLHTQRNNISGVGKVQPHMSCVAEGRLCEVRPIPHGLYSSQPRDQRPAIPLPSSSTSFSPSSSPSSIK